MESVPPTEVTTPETKPIYEVAIPRTVKVRVQKADPNEGSLGRCMLANTQYAMQFCHCIQRHIMQDSEEVHVYYPLVFIHGFIYLYIS